MHARGGVGRDDDWRHSLLASHKPHEELAGILLVCWIALVDTLKHGGQGLKLAHFLATHTEGHDRLLVYPVFFQQRRHNRHRLTRSAQALEGNGLERLCNGGCLRLLQHPVDQRQRGRVF